MRKFLSIIVLSSIVAFLAIPLMTFAQRGSPECCKLNTELEFTSGTVNTITCTPSIPCTLAKDKTVGDIAAKCPMDNNNAPFYKMEAWGMACLLNTLNGIVNWIFVILVVMVAILVIFGAFTILTSSGSPEKVTSGRNLILYAAVGLLVAFLAKAVPGVVKMISGF